MMKTLHILSRLALLALLLLSTGSISGRAAPAAASYVVNVWQDSHDANTADGVCNNGFGGCSLRAAVEQAVAVSSDTNPVTITFDDTGWSGIPITLNLGSIAITRPYITINGAGRDIKVSGLSNTTDSDIFEISNGFINIQNLTLKDSRRYGIFILAYPTAGVAHDVLIDGLTVIGSLETAIYMQSDIHIPVFSITVQNTRIGATSDSSTACVASPRQANRNGLMIVGNTEDVTIDSVRVVCNDEVGIYVMGITYQPLNTIIEDSFIGTNGTTDMGNGSAGIAVFYTLSTQIRNSVISGNDEDGVWISANDGAKLTNSKIGTDYDGDEAIPNSQQGVSLQLGSANNFIGGFTLAERNWISGNGYSGVYITDNTTHTNIVAANVIGMGTDDKPIPNGNAGVAVTGGYLNLIGVASTSVFQVISGNNREGVYIQDATGTIVNHSNIIGGSEDMKKLHGNGREGVLVVNATDSSITPYVVWDSGVIAGSAAGAGIAVTGLSAWDNSIHPDQVAFNAGLPIDLGNDGPTDNGSHSDTNGPNQWLGYPVLTGRSGQTINGKACASCRVDIYSVYGDPRAAYGGGLFLLDVYANSQGVFQAALPSGTGLVTLVASDANNNTSEMSPHLWASYLPVVRK